MQREVTTVAKVDSGIKEAAPDAKIAETTEVERTIVDSQMDHPEDDQQSKRRRNGAEKDVEITPRGHEDQVGMEEPMDEPSRGDSQPSSAPAPIRMDSSDSDSDSDSSAKGMDSPTVTYTSDRTPSDQEMVGLLHHDVKCWEFIKHSSGDIGHVDVAEVFSQPRVAEMAKTMGFTAGSSLDITGRDECGNPWKFSNKNMRDKAMKNYIEEEPYI